MKKLMTILLSVMAALLSHTALPQADNGQSEVSVAYGAGSIYYVIANGETSASEHTSGVGLISYKYYITWRFTIGLSAGIESISGNGENGNGNFVSIAPQMTFTYMDKKYKRRDGSIRLYGGVAWGFFEQNPNITTAGPWWPFGIQLTYFGLRFGSGIGGFIEFGTGYQGLINIGLSARFPKKSKTNW